MEILIFVVAALLIESVWESGKMLWADGKFSIDRLGAIIVGVVVSLGAKLDLLDMVGIHIGIPYVGMILTGVLLSRGANFLHDIIGKINQIYQDSKTE
jgi:hypothetical protein